MSKQVLKQRFNAEPDPEILHEPQEEKMEGRHKYPFYMRHGALNDMSYRERISVQKIIENALNMYMVHKGLPSLVELDPEVAPKPKKQKTV
jgi:hypothetical protein